MKKDRGTEGPAQREWLAHQYASPEGTVAKTPCPQISFRGESPGFSSKIFFFSFCILMAEQDSEKIHSFFG